MANKDLTQQLLLGALLGASVAAIASSARVPDYAKRRRLARITFQEERAAGPFWDVFSTHRRAAMADIRRAIDAGVYDAYPEERFRSLVQWHLA